MNLRYLLWSFLMTTGQVVYGQQAKGRDTATVNRLLADSKALIESDSAKATGLALQAKELANEIDFPAGEAYAFLSPEIRQIINH